MPTKLGNAGHGQENYDPNTGKYVDSEKGTASGSPSSPFVKKKRVLELDNKELASELGWKAKQGSENETLDAGSFIEDLQNKGFDLDFWMRVRDNPKIASQEDLAKFQEIDKKIHDYAEEKEAGRLFDMNFEKPEKDDDYIDTPTFASRKITLDDGGTVGATKNISHNDIIEFFERENVQLSDEDKKMINDSMVPTRLLKEVGLETEDDLADAIGEYWEDTPDDEWEPVW